MALNSATRLAIITIVGLIIAFIFRPAGLGVLFGLALFQVLLGGIDRAAGLEEAAHRNRAGRRPEGTEGRSTSDD